MRQESAAGAICLSFLRCMETGTPAKGPERLYGDGDGFTVDRSSRSTGGGDSHERTVAFPSLLPHVAVLFFSLMQGPDSARSRYLDDVAWSPPRFVRGGSHYSSEVRQ